MRPLLRPYTALNHAGGPAASTSKPQEKNHATGGLPS